MKGEISTIKTQIGNLSQEFGEKIDKAVLELKNKPSYEEVTDMIGSKVESAISKKASYSSALIGAFF